MNNLDFSNSFDLLVTDLKADMFLLWLLDSEDAAHSLSDYGDSDISAARDLLFRTLSEHINALSDLVDQA